SPTDCPAFFVSALTMATCGDFLSVGPGAMRAGVALSGGDGRCFSTSRNAPSPRPCGGGSYGEPAKAVKVRSASRRHGRRRDPRTSGRFRGGGRCGSATATRSRDARSGTPFLRRATVVGVHQIAHKLRQVRNNGQSGKGQDGEGCGGHWRTPAEGTIVGSQAVEPE